MIWDLQASQLPIKIQSKNQAFSKSPSWTQFFRLLAHLGAELLDFGTPWRPAGAKMAPKIAQVALQIMKKLIGADNLEPTLQQGLVQYAPWHHFGRFGMDLG